MVEPQSADILESYFEHRVQFTAPIFGVWTVPNPLVGSLYSCLQRWGVTLKDVAGNKDTHTLEDFQLTFNVPRMNAMVRVGLENVTFIAVNPDWSKAPALVDLFETAMSSIQQTAKTELASQEMALAMHMTPGTKSFQDKMRRLVNAEVVGSADMYGISVYRQDSSLVMDKSLKYEGGVFVRLYRKLPAGIPFSEVATILYQDELKALEFLGVEDLIQG